MFGNKNANYNLEDYTWDELEAKEQSCFPLKNQLISLILQADLAVLISSPGYFPFHHSKCYRPLEKKM